MILTSGSEGLKTMKKYAIGVDYGTESGRALIVDIHTGEEIATHVTRYKHSVIDETLPESGVALDPEWALQHPEDYIEVLGNSIPEVLRMSGIQAEDVVGIGIDFTASTILPIDQEGIPLCLKKDWRANPHSWVKLWKHHAAMEEAADINRIAEERGEAFLARYGGNLSAEWMLAKVLQIVREAPEVYEAADQFVEAGDYVVYRLTGELKRSSCQAGYKAVWHKENGYPSESFFKALHPQLENLTSTKLRGDVCSIGSKAGELTEEMAKITGLKPGTAVAVSIIDAHAAVPAVGVVAPNQMVMSMGTSTCHLLLSEKELPIEGVCGVVEDGIIPGYYAYEAGQAAVGDIFGWFVEHAVPAYIETAAKEAGCSVFSQLEQLAAEYKPGETGLLALDWWNGNRSTLMNAELSGLIVGYTLQTKPHEVYRTLIEATAFGTRRIIEAFESQGVHVNELYAAGGLTERSPLLMQIYADITGREIKIADSAQTAALGAAMFGAVAAGSAQGGYNSIEEAATRMAKVKQASYKPIPEHTAVYNELYEEYVKLYEHFGRTEKMMSRLRALKARAGE